MLRTAARVLVDNLKINGVERVFCVPGESYLAVLDALHDVDIEIVVCRHESGAAMMAEAFGKLDEQLAKLKAAADKFTAANPIDKSAHEESQKLGDAAMADARGPTWALIGMSFFAVAREGLESVFFLLALFQQSPGPAAPLGALLGLATAILLGWAVYRGGLRLDFRRFFLWTGAFIILVAGGLAAGVLRSLHEAGIWNHLQQPIWDLTRTLPVSSPLGAVLSAVLGYHDAPALGEALAWAVVVGVSLWLFFRPAAPAPDRTREA